MALWERYGAAYPGRAQTLANLGELHMRQGNVAQAAAEFRRAVSIRPRETPQALPALRRLGSSLEEQGKLGDAALAWESVLSGIERTHERNAHALLEPLAALVRIYRGQGRHEHMDAVYLRWLDCQAAQLGRRHPRMAGYDLDYAREWLARGDARRAWPRLEPWAAASSDQDPALQMSLAAACGQCQGIQGNWYAASEHYRSAVAACRSTPQEEGRLVGLLLAQANAEREDDRPLQARASYEQAAALLSDDPERQGELEWVQSQLRALGPAARDATTSLQ